MYDHRLLAVDLPTVVRVAMARNIDIKEAQQRIEASRGGYESSVGAIFPSLTPNVTALGIQGAISTPSGFALATFSHFFPAAAIEWIINPGQVAYDVIASKRRLEASQQQDQAVALETTRVAAVQYYDLVLTQAQVSVAWRAIKEAQELLRIERLRLKTGTGLPADELRAEAALAGKQASLVREDLPIDDMLVTAVRYRPDLEAVRALLAAAEADKGATLWGGLGPQAQSMGILATRPPAGSVVDTMYRQPIYRTTGGFNWSAATFGRIKSATANVNIAALDLNRQLDQVQATVVSAHQASLTAGKLIPIAKQQVTSAEEALRLTQKNLRVGTNLTIDVLQAQDAADEARLRHATAVVRYNQSQVNLLAALGLIDQANVVALPAAARVTSPPMEPAETTTR
jgi:outer membrane protein TolC